MCRLLALTGRELGEGYIRSIIEAFVESSKYDPYYERLSRGRNRAHDDGWGLAAIGLINDKPTIARHNSLEPVYHEASKRILDLFIQRISRYSVLYLILHSRKSSLGEPYGLEYTHPFMRIGEKCAAWFAHNGGANKEKLAEKLGVNPWLRVDSELLGHYIMDNVFNCVESGGNVDECVKSAYTEAREYTLQRSALNTVLLLLVDRRAYLYLTHYVKGEAEEDRKQYFTVISYGRDNLAFAGSITLKEYLLPEYKNRVMFLEPGVYRLEPGVVSKISNL
jgi:glutamine amidotransferase